MRTRWWTRLVVVLAPAAVSIAGHVTEFVTPHPWLHVLADVRLFGGSALAMLYGAYWHLTNPMPAERYPRIFGWVVLGGLFFSVVSLELYLASTLLGPYADLTLARNDGDAVRFELDFAPAGTAQ